MLAFLVFFVFRWSWGVVLKRFLFHSSSPAGKKCSHPSQECRGNLTNCSLANEQQHQEEVSMWSMTDLSGNGPTYLLSSHILSSHEPEVLKSCLVSRLRTLSSQDPPKMRQEVLINDDADEKNGDDLSPIFLHYLPNQCLHDMSVADFASHLVSTYISTSLPLSNLSTKV